MKIYTTPDDVAIIGLGDMFMADHSGINLSTVREPTAEIGRIAAETILDLINYPASKPIRHIIKCNELVVRGTTRKQVMAQVRA